MHQFSDAHQSRDTEDLKYRELRRYLWCDEHWEYTSQPYNASVEEITKKMISSVPANRFGEAAEVADAIAFLCSPSASYINGINLPVDGGRTTSL